jgi:uncharacterized protein YlzI (FlbEa/FlbD family)
MLVNTSAFAPDQANSRAQADSERQETALEMNSDLPESKAMALLKLNRINRGGEILINADHILYAEVESKTTTVHMTNNLLFSVEETLDELVERIEALEGARFQKSAERNG